MSALILVIADLDIFDSSAFGALVSPRDELLEIISRSFGLELDSPVGEVLDPTAETELRCLVARTRAKEDALHAS